MLRNILNVLKDGKLFNFLEKLKLVFPYFVSCLNLLPGIPPCDTSPCPGRLGLDFVSLSLDILHDIPTFLEFS